MRFLAAIRISACLSLIVLSLLASEFLTGPLSAGPEPSPLSLLIPTRPKPTRPPPEPPPPGPTSTPAPPSPTPTPVPPTPTNTFAPTNTPSPTPSPTNTSTPTNTPSPTPTPTHTPTPWPTRAVEGRVAATFAQLGYDTKSLSLYRPIQHYRLALPGNYRIMPTGNGLDLVVSHTSEIPGTRPLLRVEVNGLFVSAIALDTADAAYQSFHLDLPVGLLQAGSNSIAVDLETDAICAEETDVVKVTIHDESTLDFGVVVRFD